MDVSIILVNYKSISLLCNAIDSVIFNTKGIKYEIVVVDNNSYDNSKDILGGGFGDQVKYIGLNKNIGFGQANNQGLKVAKGECVFFLNPDTILVNNAVKILFDYLKENPNVGVCGGNLYDIEMNPNLSFARVLPSVWTELNTLLNNIPFNIIYGKDYEFNTKERPIGVGYITGADMMVRSSVLEKTGGFDPDFFLYYEETELTYRIRKAGFKIVNVPNAKIIHLEGKSIKSNFERQKQSLISRKIYYIKTQPYLIRIIIDLVFSIMCVFKMLVYKFLKNEEMYSIWLFSFKNR